MLTRLVTLVLFLITLCVGVAQADQEPNIIVIMADDLGYGDISCYGATKVKTPHIDRLAKEGMKFTDAHSPASICSPSRYGLVTGRSPWRLHKKGNGYRIEEGRMTIGDLVQNKGYAAAAIGKWHLGYGKKMVKPLSPGPLERGFTYHFGVPSNHNDKYRAFVENHDFFGLKPGEELKIVKGQDFPSGLEKPRVEDQVDTMLTKKAVEFIRKNADGPFLLYFTPCCPHTHITPSAPFRGSSEAGLYGDYIQELDSHVGEIAAALDELGLADNTLLVFTSDNGGAPNDFKGTQGVFLNLETDSHDIRNLFKTAKADARKAGHLNNGHWQDGKGKPYEGGHRVPFVVRWPGKVQPGTTSDQSLCLTDIFATAADVLDLKIPDDAAEDSFSFLPALLGKESEALRAMTFIQGDAKDIAITVGWKSWKLIASRSEGDQRTYQLFDLSADPGETKDVAGQHEEIVAELVAALGNAISNGRTRPVR